MSGVPEPGRAAGTVLGHLLAAASEVFERPVGPADNFFDLGGDSVMAVELSLRLAERLPFEPDVLEIASSEDLGTLASRWAETGVPT
ncbi:acyl carrier protein [Streptomyces sp. DSM 44915]|uniref:Acyl carrier protein n=1 Tax=Streptomyces chisholmiae TaxID=3075540 RepID=A0ABU2JNM6_9ACTN|nr:acyl carrier protein [Streptomyces sp. DSM 44915]MDT0266595.1 acyl carrier protein [Streptomyces sp. DSM 44915]